jgi:small GTP-binding protein
MSKSKENADTMRVITLGESGVGKTSIIRRYIHNIFDENNLSTIGLNFSFKEVKLKNGKSINIKLIDTAGQEKYKALAKSYFKNVDAVLFVFSLNSQDSFDNMKNWINLFNDNHNGKEGIPKYLIGNKADEKREVQKNMVDEFLSKNKYKYFETSAKDNNGIDELFQELSEDLYTILIEAGSNKTQNAQTLNKFKRKPKKPDCICAIKQGY